MYLTIKPVTLLKSRADGLQARGVFSPGHSIFASRITLIQTTVVRSVSRYSSGGVGRKEVTKEREWRKKEKKKWSVTVIAERNVHVSTMKNITLSFERF